MREQAPSFAYHPLAYAPSLGVFAKSDLKCACCGRSRGWVYSGSTHSIHTVGKVCPWCIADGSAHLRWNASFCQDIEDSSPHPSASQVVLTPEVIDEVMHRTPGYISWQGAIWRTHCDDVCEFHGDISPADLAALTSAEERQFRQENSWLIPESMTLTEFAQTRYDSKGSLGIYKFVCRRCQMVKLHVDMS